MSPIFTLRISAGSTYKASINGIIIDESNEPEISSTALPINEYLLRHNYLEISHLEEGTDENPIHYQVELVEHLDNSENIHFAETVFNNSQAVHKRVFEIIAIPHIEYRLSWKDCEKQNLTSEIIAQSLSLLNQLAQALKSKNIPALLGLLDERLKNVAAAYNRNWEQYLALMEREFELQLNNPLFVFWPLEKQHISVHVADEGRLLYFRNEQNNPPLMLYNRSEMLCTFFDFRISKLPEKDKFCVVL